MWIKRRKSREDQQQKSNYRKKKKKTIDLGVFITAIKIFLVSKA